MRPPTAASVAGSSVTAAAIDSSTTDRPAMPNEVSSGTPNTNSPDMATATVSAEKTHRRSGRGDRGRHRVVDVEAVATLLAEAVHHQQAVVDAKADAEHVHDVDREDRDVAERGGADEHGERRDDPADGDQHRHARRRRVRRAG